MNNHSKRIFLCLYILGTANVVSATCSPENLPQTTPDNRFIVNGDGTVSDLSTGLIWKQCREGRTQGETACGSGADNIFNWQGAIEQVNTVNQTGFADANNWRLPNIKELASLAEHACFNPSINQTIFPAAITTKFTYWSSTHNAYPFAIDLKDQAWAFDFKLGRPTSINKTALEKLSYVRLVRFSN